MSNFFDTHDRFFETSTIGTRAGASRSQRLARRWDAIVAANLDLFKGARVLDIASHDGRWSLAALEAGAKHVTGIELRANYIKSAQQNMAYYEAAADAYTFIHGDMFEVFQSFEPGQFDLILNLGLMYHITRHCDTFEQMHRLRPKAVILDTRVMPNDEPIVSFKVQAQGKSVAGIPSHGFIQLMCQFFHFRLREFDWRAISSASKEGIGPYLRGLRRTYVLEAEEDGTLLSNPAASANAIM